MAILFDALVDTGCTKSLITERLSGNCRGKSVVIAVDGSKVIYHGETTVTIEVGDKELRVFCVVANQLMPGMDVILGMDVHSWTCMVSE